MADPPPEAGPEPTADAERTADPECGPVALPADPDGWWEQICAVAMVGTGRRPMPAPGLLATGPRPDSSAETALLDALALGAAWHGAGVSARPAPPADPADVALPQTVSVAPARAVQLLELALTQPPGGVRTRDALLRHWCTHCADRGLQVPARLLPQLLELAVNRPEVRAVVVTVIGERGRWLAERSDRWRVLTQGDPAAGEEAEWQHLPLELQAVQLGELHPVDPRQALGLVENAWGTASAKERLAYLEALLPSVTMLDEPFLEAVLDDRAATVRAAAIRALDRLPDSRRARRMAARLTPLVTTTRRLLARHVEVALPGEPDDAAIRDGLEASAKTGSLPARHLRRIVTGAPLAGWTETTGLPPHQVLQSLTGDTAAQVRSSLTDAALAQSDPAWASHLLDLDPMRTQLFTVFSPGQAERVATALLPRLTPDQRITVVDGVTGPWTAEFSAIALGIAADPKATAGLVDPALERWTDRLHEHSDAVVTRWQQRLSRDSPLHGRVSRVTSFLTFRRSISEGFR